MVERRGEDLTNNTVASIQQPRHPKLSFWRENCVLRFSVLEYLQKLSGDFALNSSVPNSILVRLFNDDGIYVQECLRTRNKIEH